MIQIDPTYLRYIRDGLSSGSFRPDNPTALPEGLVGLYEEAVPVAATSRSREKTMAIWSVWALLQKEVSAQLVADVLGCPVAEILEHLAVYSKWFNAPACGQYALYHERLRAFVLQKISTDRFESSQTAIIQNCRAALLKKASDEWERYALEHLGRHLFLQAMQAPYVGNDLMALAYDTTIWSRQLEICKSYLWTKKMLDDTLLWAIAHEPEQLVECTLNIVDLHYLEQNDAPRVVELVAQNDLETAMRRIDAFGGNDKDGLQRKFTLYMLCLMELTLLDSKEKPFRRSATEQLLQHLDKNLPLDHSVLNWNDFFPSYLVFLMACEWAELELDYMVVYRRTDGWDGDWIEEIGPFSNLQINLLINTAVEKSSLLCSIAPKLAINNKIDEAILLARCIDQEKEKCISLARISTKIGELGKIDEANLLLNEAVDIAKKIPNARPKSIALRLISIEMAKQGDRKSALKIAQTINNDWYDYYKTLASITSELAKQQQFEDAIKIARNIKSLAYKSNALLEISKELSKQKKPIKAKIVLQEALKTTNEINDIDLKCSTLQLISTEFANQGFHSDSKFVMKEAMKLANKLDNNLNEEKYWSLLSIATELTRQGKIEDALETINGALSNSPGIMHVEIERLAPLSISKELVKQNKFTESALIMLSNLKKSPGLIDIWEDKSRSLLSISIGLAQQGKAQKAMKIANTIPAKVDKCIALLRISTILADRGYHEYAASSMQKARKIARTISFEEDKYEILIYISRELAKQCKDIESDKAMAQALKAARNIKVEEDMCRALFSISLELAEQGKHPDASKINLEAKKVAHNIDYNTWSKNQAHRLLSVELAREGQVNEAIVAARTITTNGLKAIAFAELLTHFFNQERDSISAAVLREALESARRENDLFWNSHAIKSICIKLAEQGKIEDAETTSLEILQTATRHECWSASAEAVKKLHGWQFALSFFQKLQSKESRTHYLRGWSASIQPYEADLSCAVEALPLVAQDPAALEQFLQFHSLYLLFFECISFDKIQRLHRTLDLQWAIDIKNASHAN